jgi:hypothetical protein
MPAARYKAVNPFGSLLTAQQSQPRKRERLLSTEMPGQQLLHAKATAESQQCPDQVH